MDDFLDEALDYMADGRWLDAIEALLDALDLEEDPRALYLLGRSYEALGDVDSAAEAYLDALDADPRSVAARGGLARVYLDAGLFEEAEDLLLDLVERFPDDSTFWAALALAQANVGSVESALESAVRAVELNPFNIEAHLLLGLFLDLAGQSAAALSQYHLILEITDDSETRDRVQARLDQLSGR